MAGTELRTWILYECRECVSPCMNVKTIGVEGPQAPSVAGVASSSL